jgi:hypothetical protein
MYPIFFFHKHKLSSITANDENYNSHLTDHGQQILSYNVMDEFTLKSVIPAYAGI